MGGKRLTLEDVYPYVDAVLNPWIHREGSVEDTEKNIRRSLQGKHGSEYIGLDVGYDISCGSVYVEVVKLERPYYE